MHEHLVGWPFVVVCDHEPLKTYWTQPPKQTRRHADEPDPAFDDAEPFPVELSASSQIVVAGFLAALADVTDSRFAVRTPRGDSRRQDWSQGPGAPECVPGVRDPRWARLRRRRRGLAAPVPSGKTELTDGHTATFVEAVLEQAHRTAGHMGFEKTLAAARRAYWWKDMVQDARDYVAACEQCRRGKSSTTRPLGLLHPLDTPSRPFERVGMDFIVGLPRVAFAGVAVDSILTVTDYLSKLVILIPLPSTSTAANVADLFLGHVYRRFGLPSALVSDRDPKFTSAFWRALNARLGIKLKMSTSAHPETDGRAEATNKIVGQTLRILCEDNPDDWILAVPACEFAMNSSVSAATGLSPFEVIHGFLPSALPRFLRGDRLPDGGFAERARLNWLRATDAIISSRVSMTHQANKGRSSDEGVFVIGGKAYVSTGGMRFPDAVSSKFIPKYIGPYEITAASPSTSTYTLALPPHLRIHPTFHSSKLRPHLPNDDARFPARSFAQPPPVVAATDAAEAEFEIEKVVDVRTRGKRREFKVRWLGYSSAEDQWRPESELKDTAPEALTTFL
ncbi:hypothetical protein JCM5296_006268, partial [Sporobolomyces johnsonii]